MGVVFDRDCKWRGKYGMRSTSLQCLTRSSYFFGTEHSVRPSVLLSVLNEYDLDVLCYELGLVQSIEASSANEHRGIKEYARRHDVVLREADVSGLRQVVDEGEFSSDCVREALKEWENGPTDLGGGDFYEEARERLGTLEAEYPEVYGFFIVLRNMRMCQVLRESLECADTVGLVVGANHFVGIAERMETV